MDKEFQQITWDEFVEHDCRQLIRLAVAEDLDRFYDWTSVSLVSPEATGKAVIRNRKQGVIAGLSAIPTVLDEMSADVAFESKFNDGDMAEPLTELGTLSGSVRQLLVAERPILNLLGKLSGIATLANEYVRAISGTTAKIYDTRKTTPGYRRLEKYATRCGGATNHRLGLYEAVMIKDNHLAFGQTTSDDGKFSPADAVTKARKFLSETLPKEKANAMIVEVEVDSLDQLRQVLSSNPDIVLLDNMVPDQLREAVELRNAKFPHVDLEASGGVNLSTVRAISETGVDRISVGALTHSAVNLDIGLDWSAK